MIDVPSGKDGRFSANFRIFWNLLFALLAAIGLNAHVVSAQTVTITNGASGVTFGQDNFDDTTGTDDNDSSVGKVSVNLAQLNAATASSFTSGYLNVVNPSGGWLVQNLPVVQGQVPANATNFALGTPDGTQDNTISSEVTFSAAPLTTAPSVTPAAFTVAQDTIDDGGRGAVGGAAAAAPAVGGLSFNLPGISTVAEVGVPNVQAADNQCTTAAIANGLTYVAAIYPRFNIPNPDSPGRGGAAGSDVLPNGIAVTTITASKAINFAAPPNNPVPTFANPVVLTPVFGGTTNSSVNNGDGTATYVTNENIQGNNKSLVGTLDLISARPSQNRAVFFSTNLPKPGDLNGGLTGNQEVQAAEAYLSQNGNAGFVSVSYQTDATSVATINDPRGPAVAGVGGIVPVNASAIAAGLPATNAPNVTFQYIYNNLLAQNMVMADYGLANGANAHAFDIIAAGTILGNPYILMQSDINQTATDPTDTDLGGGLEFSYLTTAPNGEIFLPNVGANMELQDDIVIAVPEPTSLGVLAAIGLLSLRRRKRPC